MIALALAVDKVRGRPLAAAATFTSVAIAVGLLVVLGNARAAIAQRLDEPVGVADVIVGPKGGSLDLFLSAGLNVAPPRGRVVDGLAVDLEADPRVARMAPILLEDDYRGWPVVATTSSHPGFALQDDLVELMRTDEPIAIVGVTAARALGLRPGDHIVTAHQAITGDSFRVVVVLGSGSAVADRCIFVPLGAVRHAHEAVGPEAPREDTAGPEVSLEANALLVTLKTPLDLLPILRELNDLDEVTAVDPRAEAARLHAALGGFDRYLWAAGLAILVLASLSLVATLITQVEERRRETAILRALGASFWHVVAVEVGHAAIVAGAGAIVGAGVGVVLSRALDLKDAWLSLDAAVPAAALLLAVLVSALACLPLYRVPLDDALRPDR